MSNDTSAGNTPFIAENATIVGNVNLGKNTGIWYGAVLRADKDSITVGDGSNVQDNCVIHVSKQRPVNIGRYVTIGHGAIVHGCTIKDRVLVGMGAIILNGAVIGEDTIIAAGAVVTENKTIPPGSLVMGVPGKVVRELDGDQKKSIVKNAEVYIDLAKENSNG
ncbi:carbonic anhydrase/acetyltransferase-like protein (isoleucine patch superfamily) [Methanomicrobium sp. W14]|jgi:carbonic anhydrase/acetyltransferase-like protein (isoleucine patch superfamily)|uniref:gamma carbonic anhydrase family protein n=1 Tax=Methanomicrobium sp. W14 TaxID=2817839 RepID=UPI001AE1579D|nr:gamma carbonic anhydrase family protein [Methanomicrobium sp. W14]MBP2132437.1 carbonic anhydrase/acetyltransferase-like protein (isoleucine patch superfamily) [Methanomicrobium sp. W14]